MPHLQCRYVNNNRKGYLSCKWAVVRFYPLVCRWPFGGKVVACKMCQRQLGSEACELRRADITHDTVEVSY